MKHIKKFENIEKFTKEEQEEFEDKLNTIAIYLDDKVGISEDEGFVDCTWSDYNYENDGIIYIEFDFISSMTCDIDGFDDKMDEYLSQYDTEYKYNYKIYDNNTGHDIYTIKLTDDDIERLYQDAEIYNQTKKYNL